MGTSAIEGLVSIMVPAHNAASFLKETIASVRAQTYQQWECLIVDDGSTDDTVAIAERAAQEDQRIHLILPDGKTGLASRARNRAMRQARGEFFAFLDADDKWVPEKTQRQVDYLNEHSEADGVCCWLDLFGDEERVRRESRMMYYNTNRVCHRSELIIGTPFQISTLMFRRHCYDQIGGMDEDPRLQSTEDFEYFARLISTFKIHRICETLSHYRLLAPKSSYSGRHMAIENTKAWLLFEVMQEKGFYTREEARRKRSSIYCEQAKDNLFHLNGPFRRYLLKSILSGHPPLKAVVTFALCFLPAPLLRPALMAMLSIVNWRTLRNVRNQH